MSAITHSVLKHILTDKDISQGPILSWAEHSLKGLITIILSVIMGIALAQACCLPLASTHFSRYNHSSLPQETTIQFCIKFVA